MSQGVVAVHEVKTVRGRDTDLLVVDVFPKGEPEGDTRRQPTVSETPQAL